MEINRHIGYQLENSPHKEYESPNVEEHFLADYDKTLVYPDNSPGTARHILNMIYASNESSHHNPQSIRSEACIVTSKTAVENEDNLRRLGFWGTASFISENSEIHIPGYHADRVNKGYRHLFDDSNQPYVVIKNSGSYDQAMSVLAHALDGRENEYVSTLQNTSAQDFFANTKLSPAERERAGQRRTLGLFIPRDPGVLSYIQETADAMGFKIKNGGSEFYQISCKNGTKEQAVEEYIKIYSRPGSHLRTIGFGDAEADLGFLQLCDKGVLVGDPSRRSILVPQGIVVEDAVGPMAVALHVAEAIKSRPQTKIH